MELSGLSKHKSPDKNQKSATKPKNKKPRKNKNKKDL